MYYHMPIMRTSFDIPDSLLSEAKQVIGAKTKREAVVIALTDLIQRKKSRKILELKGSLKEDYDYKAIRHKR